MREPIKKLIKQASMQIDRERDRFANTLGITGVQMSVIDFLANQPNEAADQRAIEHEFAIQRSTTTIMLQRMEKHGLIQRIVDPQDKRKKKVKLTAKAVRLVKKIKEYMIQDDQKVINNFTEAELKTIERLLRMVKSGDYKR